MEERSLFWVLLILGIVTVGALVGLYLLHNNAAPSVEPGLDLHGLIAVGEKDSWSRLLTGQFGPLVLEEDGYRIDNTSSSDWRVVSVQSDIFSLLLVRGDTTVFLRHQEGRWFGKVSTN